MNNYIWLEGEIIVFRSTDVARMKPELGATVRGDFVDIITNTGEDKETKIADEGDNNEDPLITDIAREWLLEQFNKLARTNAGLLDIDQISAILIKASQESIEE